METTLAFLDLILPDEGWRCAFVQTTKHHAFFKTNAELAEFMLRCDAEWHTVYHACATFREQHRGQKYVAAISALWQDVDAGPGKPYADANAAAAAVAAICARVNLPAPLYVCSGRGLHPYWPFDVCLEAREWRRYAIGLRNLFQREGLHIDPA